jgi:hypothetical protein
MRPRFFTALVAACSAFGCASAQATIFQDDFEAGVFDFGSTPPRFNDWTIDSGSINWSSKCTAFAPANNNSGCIELDGHHPAQIRTSIHLLGGHTYSLLFDLAGNNRITPPITCSTLIDRCSPILTDHIAVKFGQTDYDALPGIFSPFTTYSIDFAPTSTGIYDLIFEDKSYDGDSIGSLLDNVKVVPYRALPVPNSVPAPGPIGGAYAAFLLARRLRRRVRLAARAESAWLPLSHLSSRPVWPHRIERTGPEIIR